MKWLSHNHHRRFSYFPVRMQSPCAVPTSPTTHVLSPASQALIRDVKEQATIIFAVKPEDATVTDFSASEELRMSKCTRFASISPSSSDLPRHESLKSRTQVLAGTDEV